VRTIIPTADRQKATVKVRISFDKLDPRILPDMGIKVTFLGEERKEAPGSKAAAVAMPLIPQTAVRDDGGKKVVFLVKDARLERRAITLGSTRGSDTEVAAGLAIGDIVVVNGPPDLHDGQTVAIKR
jgi:multidrug efflux pump subunit AcrA (membrane-fusion protein)